MEVKQLKHLLAVAEHGCFVKAAESIHITQSGLSRSIANLEARLGVPLLVRKAKGVELTPFGSVVMNRAQFIVNEVSKSVLEVRALETGQAGHVRMAITQNYAHYLIPDVLSILQKERPNLTFEVITGGFMDLVQMVREGAIDLAFGLLGPIDDTSELEISHLREHHASVIANARHPLAHQAKVSAQELSAARWATIRSAGFNRNFIHFFDQRGLPRPIQTMKTDSIDLILRYIEETDALTVLPADVVNDALEDGSLVTLECEAPGEVTRLGLITRKATFISPHVQEMSDRLRKAVMR